MMGKIRFKAITQLFCGFGVCFFFFLIFLDCDSKDTAAAPQTICAQFLFVYFWFINTTLSFL